MPRQQPLSDDTVRMLSAGFLEHDPSGRAKLRKFSELSALKQMLSLLAVLGITGSGILSAGLYAADQKLDEKYATDSDVAQVQKRLEGNISELTTSVNANVTAQKQTASSVDALTLTVLDLQIREVAYDIEAMERDKRADPNWPQRDEARLYSKKQALDDLRKQRSILFDRLLDKSNRR